MYDIVIIGGGINGCGIARDAAGRGLSVLLAEQDDLASGTSSASTKLIHGGLRYLEQYHFRLVAESLREREVLIGIAPHITKPLRFVLPHHAGLRPAVLIRIGLFLYDHLGGRRTLPKSAAVDLKRDPAGKPLKPEFPRAFAYSDCWVDDARLVVLNAMDAAARGADIRVRTQVVSAARKRDHWEVDLRHAPSGRRETVQARALVNASGAWVQKVAGVCSVQDVPRVRLVRGSHIVVPKLFEHGSAYIFQNADGRVVFAIPYERDYTLIGTTDVDFAGDLASLAITPAETEYLCAAANEYFVRAIGPADVVWSYTGVRSLYDDGKAAAQDTTRDFVLKMDEAADAPPLLTLIGGKITTYRHVAEEAIAKLAPSFPRAGPEWTRDALLPGGNFPAGTQPKLAQDLAARFPFIGAATADRLSRAYGTMAAEILAGATRQEDLGTHFGADLYEREVAHLVGREWAMTADDILWRRSKLGLRVSQEERAGLAEWLASRVSASASPSAA